MFQSAPLTEARGDVLELNPLPLPKQGEIQSGQIYHRGELGFQSEAGVCRPSPIGYDLVMPKRVNAWYDRKWVMPTLAILTFVSMPFREDIRKAATGLRQDSLITRQL